MKAAASGKAGERAQKVSGGTLSCKAQWAGFLQEHSHHGAVRIHKPVVPSGNKTEPRHPTQNAEESNAFISKYVQVGHTRKLFFSVHTKVRGTTNDSPGVQWPPAPRGTLAPLLERITAAADAAGAGTEPTQAEQTQC